jgi:hypothetical protein
MKPKAFRKMFVDGKTVVQPAAFFIRVQVRHPMVPLLEPLTPYSHLCALVLNLWSMRRLTAAQVEVELHKQDKYTVIRKRTELALAELVTADIARVYRYNAGATIRYQLKPSLRVQ